MDYFRQTYISLAKINFTVTTQFVTTGNFMSTNSDDDATHRTMAKTYYKEGQLTVLITTFSDNTGSIITAGYTILPQSLLKDYSRYYMILDHNYAISPTGNTLLHEFGHVFGTPKSTDTLKTGRDRWSDTCLFFFFLTGLLHTFTNTDSCDLQCDEMVNSPDLNVVGDFCSDTKPVSRTFDCATLTDSKSSAIVPVSQYCRTHAVVATDCRNTPFGPINTLPQDNFMSYTPDDCQNKFTGQQVARMRCYLSAMPHLSGSIVNYVAPPFAVKQPGVSSATQICASVSAVAFAASFLL